MLRWLKTVVVSDEEKAPERRQVGIRKTSVSELPWKRRYVYQVTSKPGSQRVSGMSLAGDPCTGQVVSGVKAA